MVFTSIRSRTLQRSSTGDDPGDSNPMAPTPMEQSNPKPFSRITGYSNHIEHEQSLDSSPPAYDMVEMHLSKAKTAPTSLAAYFEEGEEHLPSYSCSVHLEGSLSMKMERTTPFDSVGNSQWEEVYCVLRGTVLMVHKLKSSHIFGKSSKSECKAGRLIRSFSLQHAEVGVAADHKKVELVPRVHFAHFLPQSTIHHLQETEPQLFESVRLYIARLRLENIQLVLRFASSEGRTEWVDKICQAIDLAPPLEDRADPKYHTLPRRRRRNRGRGRVEDMLAELMCVSSGGNQPAVTHPLATPLTSTSQADGGDGSTNEQSDTMEEALSSSIIYDPDAEDLDRTFLIQEQDQDVTSFVAADTNRSVSSQPRLLISVSQHDSQRLNWNFSTGSPVGDGDKSESAQVMSLAQEARYRRRCLPNLLFHSRRAGDVIFQDGKRWKIDWVKERLCLYQDAPMNPRPLAGNDAFIGNENLALPAYDSLDTISLGQRDSHGEDSGSSRSTDKETISWSRRIKNLALSGSENGIEATATTKRLTGSLSPRRQHEMPTHSVVSF